MLFTPADRLLFRTSGRMTPSAQPDAGMTCDGRGFGTARTRQVHPVVGRSPSVGWPSGKEGSTPTRQVLPAEPGTAGTAGGTYGESKFARVRPDRLSWWVQAEAERVGYPLHLLMRMPKGSYVLALLCYLAIPVVVIGGAGVHRLIDSEMARGHADYARNYQLLEWVRRGALMTAAGLALVLWTLCCYLVLKSRQRSLRWLPLAAAGPFGFVVIATLQDRSPAPDDLYQQFIANLRTYWRVPFEIAVFVSVWAAHQGPDGGGRLRRSSTSASNAVRAWPGDARPRLLEWDSPAPGPHLDRMAPLGPPSPCPPTPEPAITADRQHSHDHAIGVFSRSPRR